MLSNENWLKTLVASQTVPAIAWLKSGEYAINLHVELLNEDFSQNDNQQLTFWLEQVSKVPLGSAFLNGELEVWSGLLPTEGRKDNRWRLEGSCINEVYLILLHSSATIESGKFDLEETFHLLAEHSRTITWEVDVNGLYTYVSSVVELVLGYKPEELVGKVHYYELFLDYSRDNLLKAAIQYFKNQVEFKDFHNQVLKANGDWIWVSTNGIPFFDEQGNLLGYKGNDTDISLRKAAEEALEAQSRRLKLVTDNMFDMVALMEMSARITFLAKAHRSLGYDTESLIGHSYLELVHEEEVEHIEELLDSLRNEKTPELLAEYRVRCFDGTIIWLESLGKLLFDDLGSPNGILFSSRDITERKKAQDQLKVSANNYRYLFENMTQGVVFHDSKGEITAVNPAAEKILGESSEMLIGRKLDNPDWKAIREDGSEFPGNQHPAMRVLTTGKPVFDVIIGVMNPIENQHRWLLVSAVPHFDQKNYAPFQVFSSFTDITKRIQLERSLKESQRLLQDIIQNSGSLIYVKGLDGKYQAVNKMWEKILDLTEEEVLGKNDYELFSREVADQCVAADRETLKTGVTVTVEEKITNPRTFENRDFLTIQFPLRNNQGVITGLCGMSTDITNLKNAEKAHLQSEAQLKALLESAANGIWAVNKNLELTFANHIFINDFNNWVGVSLSIGDKFLHHLSESMQREILERYERVFKGEVVKVIEEIPTKDGLVFLSTTLYPILIEDEVTGAAVFSINITHEEKARQALLESEARFRSLFEDNASAMYLFNPHTDCFVDVNDAAERFFGYNRTSFLQLKPSEFVGEQQLSEDSLNRLLSEKSIRLERRMVHKSGNKVDVEVYSSFVPDGQGWLICEIIHDISVRNRYFEAMESQNKILKDIAWTQSHLVRAPLARILGLVEMLNEGEFMEMSQEQIVSLIASSADELDSVIRDISEKAYLANKLELVAEPLLTPPPIQVVVQPEVMLVDDDRIILTMHKGAVVKQGLSDTPTLFQNGETAFHYLLEHDDATKVFIIFLDLNMPVMNGWEFLEALEKKSWLAELKVIVLTSSVDTADRLRAQQYRYVVSYQNKPVNSGMISELRHHPELKLYWNQ